MSNYRKNVGKTFEFEGDTIKVIAAPMKRKEALMMVPYMTKGEDGEVKLRFEDQMAILDIGADVLPKCIKTFEGLRDADGEQITFDEAVSEFYFMSLISEILQFVLNISSTDKDDEKKSEEPLENSMEVLPVTDSLNSAG